jgi:thiamine-phosphate pyrophosphorylase
MARCYSDAVSKRHPPLPRVWLVTDARNDDFLEAIMARLPRGSGVIFRHYHLGEQQRRIRFESIRRGARRRGHWLILSADAATSRAWRADGAYGSPAPLSRGPALLRLAAVHSLRELRRAARADAVLLSPVFATRSHPGAGALRPIRFRLLAQRASVPVIALGGMTVTRARRISAKHWAAIDGLTPS